MVGLRGVGKTVLLDKIRQDADSSGIQTIRVEAPEERSLPALLAPQFRLTLLKLSKVEHAKELAEKGLRASVEGLDLPEVRYFLETFVPSFRLTLDELN